MAATNLPPITSADPASFAYGVIRQRHPAIVEQIISDLPYSSSQIERLRQLGEESRSGAVEPLVTSEADAEYWRQSASTYLGERWTAVPFLWAESFFYRRLLECVDFFRSGPWRWLDPFHPMKDRELRGEAVTTFLGQTLSVFELNSRDAFTVLMRSALLGNRADLGFQMGFHGDGAAAEGIRLLVDQTDEVWDHLSATRPKQIALIADNAGLELISDLLLCDFLITTFGCRVRLHVKPVPYYVSDATAADVVIALRLLIRMQPRLQDVHERIMDHLRHDRLILHTHEFYCRPECFFQAPTDLLRELGNAEIAFVKGDLNYRRLVGDVMWDPLIAFADSVDYFPTSVVALRMLKSDVMVGLDRATLAGLDGTGRRWRTDGSHGVVQAHLTLDHRS